LLSRNADPLLEDVTTSSRFLYLCGFYSIFVSLILIENIDYQFDVDSMEAEDVNGCILEELIERRISGTKVLSLLTASRPYAFSGVELSK
jgi:hypothetical protein